MCDTSFFFLPDDCAKSNFAAVRHPASIFQSSSTVVSHGQSMYHFEQASLLAHVQTSDRVLLRDCAAWLSAGSGCSNVLFTPSVGMCGLIYVTNEGA